LKNGDGVLEYDFPDDVDKVYHLAAQTDAYCRYALADAEANVLGAVRVMEKYGSKVVFASSAMVNYLVNPYAISKKAGEDYARFFGAAIVRLCNVFGPGGHGVFERFEAAKELTIYGSGEQLRTYVSVHEAVDHLICAKAGETDVVRGVDLTVAKIADLFPKKKRNYLPAKDGDLIDGRQVY